MTYRNPWALPYEPQFFETSVAPKLYAGCEIYHRGGGYDVVKAGTCISQRCTLVGAMGTADTVADLLAPTSDDVHDRMMALHDCL